MKRPVKWPRKPLRNTTPSDTLYAAFRAIPGYRDATINID